MNKKFGLCIVLSLMVGANFGIFFAPAIENTPLAIVLSILTSVFIGWFIAAALLENSKGKDKTDDQ